MLFLALVVIALVIALLLFGCEYKDPSKEDYTQDVDSSFFNGNLSLDNPVNIRYWPWYYYSIPYEYRDSGAWPPGMYTRMNNWYPGYSTGTGWNFQMRPGVHNKAWPRDRWVKKNLNRYFINNGTSEDRRNDFL
jgi:hypothetical protein